MSLTTAGSEIPQVHISISLKLGSGDRAGIADGSRREHWNFSDCRSVGTDRCARAAWGGGRNRRRLARGASADLVFGAPGCVTYLFMGIRFCWIVRPSASDLTLGQRLVQTEVVNAGSVFP